MRWNSLTQMIIAAYIKLIVVLLVLTLASSLICSVLDGTHSSTTWALKFLLLWALVSPIAYLIRKHRLNQRPRLRSSRGAERTPLLPRFMEDA